MTFQNTLLKYRESNNGDVNMSGVEFNGKINSIGAAQSTTTAANISEDQKLGVWGFGHNSNNAQLEIHRYIPGLEELTAKFDDVEIPKYTKDIAQLEIDDRYFIEDKCLEEPQLCEA